jgi:hypothetical protein
MATAVDMKTASFFTYTGPRLVSIARWVPPPRPAGYRVFKALALIPVIHAFDAGADIDAGRGSSGQAQGCPVCSVWTRSMALILLRTRRFRRRSGSEGE